MISKVHAKGALVVLLGVTGLPLGDQYGPNYKTLARETGCVLVPDILSGIIGNTKLKSDQIHPNGAGYAKIAARVYDAIKKYIG
jgi:acyl-CoA thioesterase-1